jgi:hypothetical protein
MNMLETNSQTVPSKKLKPWVPCFGNPAIRNDLTRGFASQPRAGLPLSRRRACYLIANFLQQGVFPAERFGAAEFFRRHGGALTAKSVMKDVLENDPTELGTPGVTSVSAR